MRPRREYALRRTGGTERVYIKGEGVSSIRLAIESDIDEICSFDHIAQQSDDRKAFIQHSVIAEDCHVAIGDNHVMAYAVLEHSFYGRGFVSMLYVDPDWRREGVGSALVRHLESLCRTDRLFTSTNLSNLPMQSLLTKLDYELSGVIHGLDEGDPELIYVKYLQQCG